MNTQTASLSVKCEALFRSGKVLKCLGVKAEWPGYDCGLTIEEYQFFLDLIERVKNFNAWFTPDQVRLVFLNWGEVLSVNELDGWLAQYAEQLATTRKVRSVGMVLAGNIPMVGLHDVICGYLSGHKVQLKLSSDDDKLIPAFIKLLSVFDEDAQEQLKVVERKLTEFDAVIATGSNNTSKYFEQYFGHVPHVIRKGRTSVAVLDGTETAEELTRLGSDVFSYFGRGCRSITKLYLPVGFNINLIFEAFYIYRDVANHNKYINNHDYHKAIYLMESTDILDNDFIILKQDSALYSPVGTLHYEFYQNPGQLDEELKSQKEDIQCVVGKQYLPFGKAQCPSLWDYADGVDTFAFLLGLK